MPIHNMYHVDSASMGCIVAELLTCLAEAEKALRWQARTTCLDAIIVSVGIA